MNMWRGLWFVVWFEVSCGAACVCGQGRAGLMVAVMARGVMTSRLNVSIGAVAKLATSGRCPDKLVAQTVAPFFPRCWHLTGAPISAGPPLPTNACVSEEFAPDEPGWGERGYAPRLMYLFSIALIRQLAGDVDGLGGAVVGHGHLHEHGVFDACAVLHAEIDQWGGVQVQYDEVGFHAWCDAANFVVEVQGLRGAAGGPVEGLGGG